MLFFTGMTIYQSQLTSRLFSALVATIAWCAPVVAHCDVIIPVVSSADSGAGSLRAAVAQANATPADTAVIIDLIALQSITNPAAPVIGLTSGPLNLQRGMQILANAGPAAPVLRSPAGDTRLITIHPAATGTVALSHLVLENGYDPEGGGAIHYQQATTGGPLSLVLQGCVLRGNQVGSATTGASRTYGGAVFFNGRPGNPHIPSLTLANCLFEANSALASEVPAPQARGSAVYAESTLLVAEDTSFSGNYNNSKATAFGGTLVVVNCATPARFTRCTFTGNDSAGGVNSLLVSGTGLIEDGGSSVLIESSV